jgi:hypothetical protein
LVEPGRTLPSHAAHQLRVSALDGEGRSLDYRLPLRWTSSDTTVATVDSTGLLRPRRDGRTRVTVSASGWRTDSATFEIHASPSHVVLVEPWDSGLARWVPFGVPVPEIYRDRDGNTSFWNKGDGSYLSGAYSRDAWPGDLGFGVEVDISMPLTALQGQAASVELVGGLDSGALGGWDHQRGPPPVEGLRTQTCGAAFPATEGAEGASRLAIIAAGLLTTPAVNRELVDGRWFRLRLQLFPDGTCGTAIDGHPLWRSPVSVPLDRPFAIVLGHASAGTRALHGRLTAWTGVRDDVDWPSLGFQGH